MTYGLCSHVNTSISYINAIELAHCSPTFTLPFIENWKKKFWLGHGSKERWFIGLEIINSIRSVFAHSSIRPSTMISMQAKKCCCFSVLVQLSKCRQYYYYCFCLSTSAAAEYQRNPPGLLSDTILDNFVLQNDDTRRILKFGQFSHESKSRMQSS